MLRLQFKLGNPLCAFASLLALVLFSVLVCLLILWSDSIPLSEMQSIFSKNSEVLEFERILNPTYAPAIDPIAIKVMIASDGRHLVGVIATIHSIVSNTASPVFFYLVTSADTAFHLKEWISESKLKGIFFTILTVKEDQFSGKNIKLSRFYVPVLFPEIEGILIYVDDDCIVQGDIKQLAQMRIEDGHCGVFSSDCTSVSKRVHVVSHRYSNYINFNNPRIKSIKLNPGACSFDTKVFVANITKWKMNNITEKLQYWTHLNDKENLFRTQLDNEGAEPATMIVLYHKITLMDPMWNVRHLGISGQSSFSSRFLQQAKLLQWDGPFKPWSRRSSHNEIWERYSIPDPRQVFH